MCNAPSREGWGTRRVAPLRKLADPGCVVRAEFVDAATEVVPHGTIALARPHPNVRFAGIPSSSETTKDVRASRYRGARRRAAEFALQGSQLGQGRDLAAGQEAAGNASSDLR